MASRQETKRQTRHELVLSGLDVLSLHGLDASLDSICENAGFTRGAFYVHFSDREDFLFACMQRVGKPLLDAIFDNDEADFEAIAARFVSAFVDGSYPLSPSGAIRPHQLIEACAKYPRIAALYVALVTEAIERATTKIDAAQCADRLRSDVPARTIAEMLLALIIGAQTMMDLDPTLGSIQSAAGAVLILLKR